MVCKVAGNYFAEKQVGDIGNFAGVDRKMVFLLD
jgi:hypothetical protein